MLYELKQMSIPPGPIREDILQDVVLKLIANENRAVRRFLANPQSTSFAAYLRVVVKNAALTHLKLIHRLEGTSELHEETVEYSQNSQEWSQDPAIRLERNVSLDSRLLAVTGNDRSSEAYQILYLRFVDNQQVNVIARKLGMKPNTVSQRIKYYLLKLREQQEISH
jgi:RNA polymerase sigma factor (sigma-70 family)